MWSSIGNVAAGLIHELESAQAGIDPLKGHPGHGTDVLAYGRSRMHIHMVLGEDREKQAWEAVQAEYEKGQRLCESPIERAMLAALLTADWSFLSVEIPAVHNSKDYDEPFPRCPVTIVPQMAIVRYRLDFGIVLQSPDNGPGKVFGAECDGADFHDREKDSHRDWYLRSVGVPVFRFTGRTLTIEPLRAADEMVEILKILAAK